MNTAPVNDFSTLWTCHESTLRAWFFGALRNHHIAEDALQRLAIELLQRHEHYDSSQSFVAWALGHAKIEVLRLRQEQQRDRLCFSSDTLEQISEAMARVSSEESHARLAYLKTCLHTLKGAAKKAIELTYMKSYDGESAAQKMSISRSHLHVILHRGRKHLRDCVQHHLDTNQ